MGLEPGIEEGEDLRAALAVREAVLQGKIPLYERGRSVREGSHSKRTEMAAAPRRKKRSGGRVQHGAFAVDQKSKPAARATPPEETRIDKDGKLYTKKSSR